MGGTLFAGRAVVAEALDAGHDVTTFNRGQTNPTLFDGDVEKLIGDRNDDLDLLAGRSYDVVVDTSAYLPRHVTSVVEALDSQIGHYSFVSSCSVYASHERIGADESDPVAELPAHVDRDDAESVEANYGPLKALCERALDEVLPGRAHHCRAGLIVGPHDDVGRFGYWLERVAGGGEVLAPGPPDNPMQLIDVRDLANWLLVAAEAGVTGPGQRCRRPRRDHDGIDARRDRNGSERILDPRLDRPGIPRRRGRRTLERLADVASASHVGDPRRVPAAAQTIGPEQTA